jgi:hypothetical protein
VTNLGYIHGDLRVTVSPGTVPAPYKGLLWRHADGSFVSMVSGLDMSGELPWTPAQGK